MSDADGFTVKEIVLDIRKDVRDLAIKIEKIDREGSIGTKAELSDQESRIRELEKSGFRLSGVWATLSITAASVAGIAGFVFGVLAYVGG